LVRRHWEFDPAREIRCRTFDEYAECFRALFEQSVRRRTRNARPVAVSVSGGLDSSSVFCQASALAAGARGAPAVRGISMTFSAGSPADEQEFLDELEVAAGNPIERVPIGEEHLFGDVQPVVLAHERPELVWGSFSQVVTKARRAGCAVLLDGYFGDELLFPRRYLVDLAYRGSWLKIRRDLREFGAWMNGESKFFEQEFRQSLARSMLPRPLFQVVKRGVSRRRAARYPAWYTKAFIRRVLDRQMTRFESGSRFANRHAEECFRNATAGHYLFHVQRQVTAAAALGVDLASPFRDRDLVAFMMAVPGEVISWQGVPKGLLRQALRGVLPERIRRRRWKADFTLLANASALKDFDTIQRLLSADSIAVAAGFVDGRVLTETLLKFKTLIAEDDDSAVACWRLIELAALELWLRQFFGAGAVCTTS
jgi:asparagine synthase (glutamine-hydrolysing)